MGVTRYDIERIQQEAGEEGTPDISFEVIHQKDGHGKEIDYHGLDIHHNLADHTIWQGIDLTGMQVSHASLIGARFYGSGCIQVNFDWADMRDTVMKKCWLSDASLLQAKLNKALIADCILNRANLGASLLEQATMRDCTAQDIIFAGARCVQTHFLTCDLQRADFQHTNLNNAIFQTCDLTAANLSHTNLTNAVFDHDCLFTQVDLAYADITGLCISEEQLRSTNLLHIHQCFEKICDIWSISAVIDYRKEVLHKGKPYSLPAFLGIALVSNGPAHCIEQFTHGLIPKKNEHGDIDGRYSDQPVRTILLEWIENWLSQ